MQTGIHFHDGRMTVASTQDCTAIAEACKRQSIEGVQGTNEFKFAGRIPDVFVEKYITDNNITFREFIGNRDHVKRILNDPAMAHFRIWRGVV